MLMFITINTYSQKFQSDYNIVIDYNGKELEAIVSQEAFKKLFG
jgi:hypothetical protein